jgi:hypothetical protein
MFSINFLNNILRGYLLHALRVLIMDSGNAPQNSLDEYRQYEMKLHLELMNTCRRYMSNLSIVSITGILDIVKQEAIELEMATRKSFKREEIGQENIDPM